jgi:beta-galactosidase/beta-glucuronidase
LVPFPLESALSGVMTNLTAQSRLWYHRVFAVPTAWRGRHVRLHFGAVDWSCRVWVNGREVGRHQGGYDAFTFDITPALRWRGAEEITLGVTDPTEGDQPRGKQSRSPGGIFYTSTSGIWQTVWLEPVPEICLDCLRCIPDVDARVLRLWSYANSLSPSLRVEVAVSAGGEEVARLTGSPDAALALRLPYPHLWSPDDPFLYDLKVTLKDRNKTLDSVSSYFGMRKIALAKDEHGVSRIALNNKFLFLVGTLDQGFWPDGIYTAPTDEALRSDIEFLRKAKFNLVRKHVKVEPERWYYWCDKLGLLVWQDMPNGNNTTPGAKRDFENELLHMVSSLENHPSIIAWELFNEGWGQYDTEALTQWLKLMDPSRLVDDAGGYTDMLVGDVIDMHNYPGPGCPAPDGFRAAVLGEFGGFGCCIVGHSWSPRWWGYVMMPDERELASAYVRALQQAWAFNRERGLSAAVYTQTTDIETECNGLLTYDRAVAKIDPATLRTANLGLMGSASLKFSSPKPPPTSSP